MADTRALLDKYAPNWQQQGIAQAYPLDLQDSLSDFPNVMRRYDLSNNERQQFDLAGRIYNNNSFTIDPNPEIEVGKRRNLAMKRLSGLARGASDLIEPLNFLKDTLIDAPLAGALDPNTTIMDRWRRLDVGAYFDAYTRPDKFWSGTTRIAPRATSGKEIFELAGSDNKIFNAGAGFAFDILADPLLAGSAISAAGRVVGIFGKVSPKMAQASAMLLRGGKAVDEFLSLGGAYKNLGRLSPETKGFIDSRVSELIQTVVDPNAWWNTATHSITDRILPRKTALGLKHGAFGDEIFDMYAQSQQGADDFLEQVMELTMNAERKLLGITSTKDYFKAVNKEFTKYRDSAKKIIGVPKLLHATATREAVRAVDQTGLLAVQNADNVIEPLQDIYGILSKSKTNVNLDAIEEGANRVREVANKFRGVDTEDFVSRWKEYVLDYSQIDALVGFKKSGYELVEKAWYKNASLMGINATDSQRIWEDMFQAGVEGNWESKLQAPTRYAPRLQSVDDARFSVTNKRQEFKDNVGRINTGVDAKKNRITNRYQRQIDSVKRKLNNIYAGYDDNIKAAYNSYTSAFDEYNSLARTPPKLVVNQASTPLSEVQGQTISSFVNKEEEVRAAAKSSISQMQAQLDQLHSGYSDEVKAAYQEFKNAAMNKEQQLEIRNQFRNVYPSEDVIEMEPRLRTRYQQINNGVNFAEESYNKALEKLSNIRGQNIGLSQEATMLEEQIRNITNQLNGQLDQLNATRNQALQSNRASYNNARNQEYAAKLDAAKQAMEEAKANLQNVRASRGSPNPQAAQLEDQIRTLEKELDDNLTNLQAEEAKNVAQVRQFINDTNKALQDEANFISKSVRDDAVSKAILDKRINVQGMGEAEALDKPFTLGEIIGHTAEFQALPLNTFFKGITSGHMRRAYGLFLSQGGADSYVNGIRRNKIIPTKFLDEQRVNKVLSPEIAQHVNEYIGTVANGGSFMMGKNELITHLQNRGVSANDAVKSIKELIKDANPEIAGFIDELSPIVAKYDNINAQVADRQLLSIGGKFDAERKVIDEEFLLKLGELANPLTSIVESATGATPKLSAQNFMNNMYSAAKERGLVSTTQKSGWKKLGGSTYYGPFADQWVNPFIHQEITRAMLNPTKRAGVWQHALNVVTSSYLAAPNVIFGNLMGGVYTSAAAGINPVDMMRSLAGNFQRVAKYTGKDMHDPMIDLLKEHVSLNLSSQITQLFARDLGRFRLEKAGLEKEGFQQLVQRFSDFYKNQLNAPGIGDFRLKWAGLEGFQWVENWMKVSAFNASVDDALRQAGKFDIIGNWQAIRESTDPDVVKAIKYGAEKARIAVFDYSEMPDSIKTLQRTGVLIFPGFQYFSLGRTLSAAVNKPGVLGAADRIPDAISNAALDEDQRYKLFFGMDEWMQDEHGVPIAVRQQEDGSSRVTTIPVSQLIPSTTFADTRWIESLASLGIYKPLVESAMAHLRGDGEAIFSGRYGQRVFDESDPTRTRAAKTTEFILSNLTPTVVRKLGLTPQDLRDIGEGQASSGLLGAFRATQFNLPDSMAGTIYRLDELQRNKPLRSVADEYISLFIRAPQVYQFGGQLDSVVRQFDVSMSENDRIVRELEKKAEMALQYGETQRANNYMNQANQLEQEWLDRWTNASQLMQIDTPFSSSRQGF